MALYHTGINRDTEYKTITIIAVAMKLTGLTPTEIMEIIDVTLCLPLVLLMNFALFQYLFTTFFRRRREPLVSTLR